MSPLAHMGAEPGNYANGKEADFQDLAKAGMSAHGCESVSLGFCVALVVKSCTCESGAPPDASGSVVRVFFCCGGVNGAPLAALLERAPPRSLPSPRLRHQLAQARELEIPEDCIRVLECKVMKEEAEMKQAQPMGQRMDQARARFRRAVEASEKAQEAMMKGDWTCTSS